MQGETLKICCVCLLDI